MIVFFSFFWKVYDVVIFNSCVLGLNVFRGFLIRFLLVVSICRGSVVYCVFFYLFRRYWGDIVFDRGVCFYGVIF